MLTAKQPESGEHVQATGESKVCVGGRHDQAFSKRKRPSFGSDVFFQDGDVSKNVHATSAQQAFAVSDHTVRRPIDLDQSTRCGFRRVIKHNTSAVRGLYGR